MKKSILVLSVFFSLLYFNGCAEEDVINNPVNSTKGIYVLYEGSFNQPATYDYAFISKNPDTVYPNVYQNSNSGAHLNAVPDGMALYSGSLFVLAQGNFGGQGTIYKINPDNNQLVSSKSFGTNPYSFAFGNSKIFISNTASSYVNVMDMGFGAINDSISVGPSPADLIYAGNYVFVSKQSYTFENSLAVINNSNYQVSKIFFTGAPVSIALNSNKIYVSTYSHKKLYAVDVSSAQVSDSIEMQIPEAATGNLVAGDSHTLYVLGTDTAFQYNLGKSIYKVDIITKSINPAFTVHFSGSDDIYGIDFDAVVGKIYISNSKNGLSNGEVRVYDQNGSLVKTYSNIGGKFPKRMVFKY